MSKGVIIDSCFLGNKTRFMNHGNDGEDNVISENKLCNGDYVIAFYANRDIKAGE
jgi:SET domain-containing protein